MKRFIQLFAALVLLCSILSCQAYAQGESWYFKKKGNEPPTSGVSDDFLRQTNSVWLDTASNGDKVIYLTFDVGYINDNVISVLDILKEENVTAAFFVLGHPILKNTADILRMKEDGHLVCSHTKGHGDISEMTDAELESELTTLEKIYEEKTGYTLDKYFRPPEGKYSKRALLTVKQLGYRTVFWSYAYADWDEKTEHNEAKILKKLTDNAHPGEILLLHPTSTINAKVLRPFIRAMKEKGYRFSSLDKIL